MNRNLQIRDAQVIDAQDVSELIYSTSLACCFTMEQPCPDWFEQSVNPTHIEKFINDAEMDWLVAFDDTHLVGVLAINGRNHVKYYFVSPNYQGKGVGKALWNVASQKGILDKSLTVRSSLNAVPVYEHLGFVAVEPPKIFNGLHYQTMTSKKS